jgi:hypothetical protein
MTKIVEELQARVAESKQRLDEVTKAFQTAQQIFQQAQQDHNIWSLALQAELRDEQRRTAAREENQLPLPTVKVDILAEPVPGPSVDNSETLNKTDIVRDLLRRHPAGMTAIEIWKEVNAEFKHRPYLYSVLKRLRDRDEVTMRRNRYSLKLAPKVEEAQAQPVVH